MAVKVYEKHLFPNGIVAIVSPNFVSLFTSQNKKEFVFQNSKLEVAEQVAKCILEAVAIAKKQKKEDFGIVKKVAAKKKA